MIVAKALDSILTPALLALSLTSSDTLLGVPSSSNRLTSTVAAASAPRTKSPTEDYLPRRLYPGTYSNYCGPTPEIDRAGGCVAHGWHSDDALDAVDAACRLHDVRYCQCEAQLLKRRHATLGDVSGTDDSSIPMLSSLTALRFATRPAMNSMGIDQAYYQCINQADRQLIATGLEIRGQQQRTACGTDPALAWFCRTGSSARTSGRDTLGAFEKVSLNIFLRSLDDDDNLQSNSQAATTVAATWAPWWKTSRPISAMTTSSGGSQSSSSLSLSALEDRRRRDLQQELRQGKSLADAAASERVVQDEAAMLQRLRGSDNTEGSTVEPSSSLPSSQY